MVLILSVCWQVSVQFSPTLRDYPVRLLTRRRMSALRKQCKTEDDIDWTSVDEKVIMELVSYKTLVKQQRSPGAERVAWQDVPIKVRVERYIQFTSTFSLGRSADQLMGLLKDDMEKTINTFEDQRLSAPEPAEEKDHSPHSHLKTHSSDARLRRLTKADDLDTRSF